MDNDGFVMTKKRRREQKRLVALNQRGVDVSIANRDKQGRDSSLAMHLLFYDFYFFVVGCSRDILSCLWID